jgi:hypothetical protein
MQWTVVAVVCVIVLIPGLIFMWLMADSGARDRIRRAFAWLNSGGSRAAGATRGGFDRGFGAAGKARGNLSRGLDSVLGVAKDELTEWRRVQRRIREHPKLDGPSIYPRRRGVSRAERDRLTDRWNTAQAQFLDDPGRSIETADRLVQDVLRQRGYALEASQEGAGGPGRRYWEVRVQTATTADEQRRKMLQYRSLFQALLSEEERSPGLANRHMAGRSS